MVSGVVELIPLFLEFGSKAFTYFKKLMKGSTSDFKSTLESVNPILTVMKSLIDDMKQVEGKCQWEAFKKLMQTVEYGKRLILESKSYRDKKEYLKRVQAWMDSFRDFILLAMFQVHLSTASCLKEIQQQLSLLLKHQTPQKHFQQHLPAPFLAPQQLLLSKDELLKDEKYEVAFQKFIDCVNMFGGLDPLLQGLEYVSTHKTEHAEKLKELPKSKKPKLEMTNTPGKTSMALGTSTVKVATHYQIRIPESDHSHIVNVVDKKRPKTEMRMLHFSASVCDQARKDLIKSSRSCVKGVLNAETMEQPNQQDLVILKVTKDFVMEDFMKYLKQLFNPKYVNFIKEFPYEEEGRTIGVKSARRD